MYELIGQKLRQKREEKSLSIEKVAEETFIRARHLNALEQGDFGALPSAAQVRGFLRSYADYLGLNAEEILASLQEPKQDLEVDEGSSQENVSEEEARSKKEQVKLIFTEIGEAIKARREMLGLSLEDVEGHTHIPAHYLNLIETAAFERFPSPVQARGMLGNYADFLDMDSNAVLGRYAEALQSRLLLQQLEEQPRTRKGEARRPLLPLWLRNWLSVDVLIFGVLGLAIVIFVVWGIGRVLNTQASIVPQPTAPSLAQVLLPSPTILETATATLAAADEPGIAIDEPLIEGDVTEEATPEITLQSFSGENIQVYIIVRQRTYLKVIVDGEVEFDGRAMPGTNLPYTANQQIEILTGNGAALQVFFNDLDMGPLGIYGEVIDVIYSREGVLTPTATITPTIDPADQPTATPQPLLPTEQP